MPDSHKIHEVFPEPAESSKSLGFELLDMDLNEWTARVRFEGRKEFTNPAGYIQGGYLSAMLDDTIGMDWRTLRDDPQPSLLDEWFPRRA